MPMPSSCITKPRGLFFLSFFLPLLTSALNSAAKTLQSLLEIAWKLLTCQNICLL